MLVQICIKDKCSTSKVGMQTYKEVMEGTSMQYISNNEVQTTTEILEKTSKQEVGPNQRSGKKIMGSHYRESAGNFVSFVPP